MGGARADGLLAEKRLPVEARFERGGAVTLTCKKVRFAEDIFARMGFLNASCAGEPSSGTRICADGVRGVPAPRNAFQRNAKVSSLASCFSPAEKRLPVERKSARRWAMAGGHQCRHRSPSVKNAWSCCYRARLAVDVAQGVQYYAGCEITQPDRVERHACTRPSETPRPRLLSRRARTAAASERDARCVRPSRTR